MVSWAKLFRPKHFAELTTITASRYRARASRPSAASSVASRRLLMPQHSPPLRGGEYPNVEQPTSLIIDPEDGRLPALTPLGQKIRAEIEAEEASRTIGNETICNSWADHSLYTRCFTRPIPRIGQAYNHGVQILQMPGYVAIHYESMHDVRIIPLDGRPHADPNINVPQPRSTIPLPSESWTSINTQ